MEYPILIELDPVSYLKLLLIFVKNIIVTVILHSIVINNTIGYLIDIINPIKLTKTKNPLYCQRVFC